MFEQRESQVLVKLLPHVGAGHSATQVDPLKYKGELQLKQKVEVPWQDAQFPSQVLHIRLSAESPYWLVNVHDNAQDLVLLFPHSGLGQANTQAVELRKFGALQLVQVIDVERQVKQFGSQVLQNLLSETSPNSFELAQLLSHVLVLLLPQVGDGHCATQVFPARYKGAPQLVHVIAVPEQVAQLGPHVLHILLSEVSPYS
jgi:hypothetical protein